MSTLEGWDREAHPHGGFSRDGFWVGVHEPSGKLELQHGADDHVVLELGVLQELLARVGLVLVSTADKAALEANAAIGKQVRDMRVPARLGGDFYFDRTARAKLWQLCLAAEVISPGENSIP